MTALSPEWDRWFDEAFTDLVTSDPDLLRTEFAAVIDAKSPWTYRHSDRTSVIATTIAAALDAGPDTLHGLRRAARLHDVRSIRCQGPRTRLSTCRRISGEINGKSSSCTETSTRSTWLA